MKNREVVFENVKKVFFLYFLILKLETEDFLAKTNKK